MPAFLHQALENSWVTLKLVFVVYAAGYVLERVARAHREQPWGGTIFNVLYAIPFVFLTQLLVPPLAALTKPWIDGHGGLLEVHMPAGFAGQLVQGLVYFLAFDFFYYWFHRAQHRFGWFWAQHKFHHADRCVNVTSGQRHHFLEEPLRVFLVMLPFGTLFAIPPPDIAWLWSGLLLWGYFIHLNLRLPLGPLTPVIAGPQLHRLHHSNLPQHTDVNFAAFFPVWDIVFGTYLKPLQGEWPATGTHDDADMDRFGTALFSPFRDNWRALAARRRRGSSTP